MITIRRSADRGHANHGWLDSYHTFSFANYYDPAHMGFRCLRVINEDRIEPGKGFPTHSHRDMEIISYAISGSIAHRDSLGNTERIEAGGIQKFSAGTGIAHSEFNPSDTEPAHFLQIWILPEKQGLPPSYEQTMFAPEAKQGQWRTIASRDAADGSAKINQDAGLYATILEPGEHRGYTLRPGRHAWVQVVWGDVNLNNTPLRAGDGAAISDELSLDLTTDTGAEMILFDLA